MASAHTITPDLTKILQERFKLAKFRGVQQEVCQTVSQGQDVLLVMPTGAGKSLCFQVPGIARGGTTLVISPLLALIDDQVSKLKALNFKTERIHSGCAREASREVCRNFLRGELDFLFIAPERLAVPGFADLLGKKPPRLIAIDEAHCISQWGHDFRPDYRLVGERLKKVRGIGNLTPIIALTATATPVVQNDICQQLGLVQPKKYIQGFRRTNIAIQMAEVAPKNRPELILEILKGPERLPAIVYAPTRKKAEEIKDHLQDTFRVESYHAGLTSEARDRVQTKFLSGQRDVIVATVAFGMGIDKADIRTVIHAASPGSVEGYYQEIGRAGRDGAASVAILLHSYADQKTHEFFLNLNYPETDELRKIFQKIENLPAPPQPKDSLRRKLKSMDFETFEKSLEQLWIHRGALIDPEENISRGEKGWDRTYLLQREQKKKQCDQMLALISSPHCRMKSLVKHFGDLQDATTPCGRCDQCSPQELLIPSTARAPSTLEKKIILAILTELKREDQLAVGRLFECAQKLGCERGPFEEILKVMIQQALLTLTEASFEKNGKTISFRKARLTSSGSQLTSSQVELLVINVVGKSGGQIDEKGAQVKNKPLVKKRKLQPTLPLDQVEVPAEVVKAFGKLREWRLNIAREKGIPAFRVLTDRVLLKICELNPNAQSELLGIPGVPQKAMIQYSKALFDLLKESRS